jgi:hypothetical protein
LVSFTSTGVGGCVGVVVEASISEPHGEEILANLTMNQAAGTVSGTVVVKGAGKGR